MIEVKYAGALIVLTAAEFGKLLAAKPDIWEAALKRGKAIIRARQRKNRKHGSVMKAELEIADKVKGCL